MRPDIVPFSGRGRAGIYRPSTLASGMRVLHRWTAIILGVGISLKAAPMSDVTRILSQIESGDPTAAEQLLPLVYDELRKLAAERMAQEKPGQTLQATALVHEAYIRLVDGEGPALGQPGTLLREQRPARCDAF